MSELLYSAARNFRFGRKAIGYSLAVVGPFSAAGAQFLISLHTLRVADAPSFGTFSFLLVTSTFACSVWGAMFCAPLPIVVTTGAEAWRAEKLAALFSASGLGAVAVGLFYLPLGASLGVSIPSAVAFSCYAVFALLRWFARQHAYVTRRPMRTVASDLVYSGGLLAGVGTIAYLHATSLAAPFFALMAAAVFSLLPFGGDYFRRQFLEFSVLRLRGYVEIWRRYSSWTLIGVATTEATANAHAYIVTLFLGPSAYAPLSAAQLLLRPVGIVMNALSDFERPQLARLLHGGPREQAAPSLWPFRLALVAVWAGTVFLGAALIIYEPRLIFPSQYSAPYLAKATAIWMVVAVVRLSRTPEGILLQAAGVFRPLAWASIGSSVVSVALVAILLAIGGAMASMFGILIGEGTYAVWIHVQLKRWRRSATLAPNAARLSPLLSSACVVQPIGPPYESDGRNQGAE